jgi:hypothetical protein
MQLRTRGFDADELLILTLIAGSLASFSEGRAEARAAALAGGVAAEIVTSGPCDMMEPDNRLGSPWIYLTMMHSVVLLDALAWLFVQTDGGRRLARGGGGSSYPR